MSRRQQAQLATALFRWFSRLSFGVQMTLVLVALLAYAGWVYLQTHPQVSVPPVASTAQVDSCADKLPYGAPEVVGSPGADLGALRMVCRTGYVLGHSAVTRTPLWVAEHLTADAIGGHEPRTNEFLEDPEIPQQERAWLKDYRGSGYDRGHMAPAADFSRSAEQMRESFYLSNMVPQDGENNRGPWAQLEAHVRSLTRKATDLYAVTGPVFPGKPFTTTPSGRVGVPERLYKLALDAKTGRLGAWLLPNAEVPKDGWNRYCTSGAEVEKATGLKFFPNLPALQREALMQMNCAL